MSHIYKIPKYLNSQSADDDFNRRYEIVRKLSRDFTQDHPKAIEMDDLMIVAIQKDSANAEKAKEATTTKTSTIPKKAATKTATKTIKKTGNSELDEITEGMLNIYSGLTELANRNQSGSTPKFTSKISYEQLEDDLQERIGKVQKIQYQLPNQATSPTIVKSDIPEFQKIVDDVVLGQNVFLVGGAGTGKTTLAQNVAQAIGREYMTINCSQWTAPTEVIGGQTLDGYQEGKLIEAWKQGLILILDELPKIDSNTAGLFNDALAKSKIAGAVIFNSRKEHFTKHPNFAVIATGNVWPNTESMAYGANNKQDLSLLDRFAGSVYTIEKNEELEKRIIGSDSLWNYCNTLRLSIEQLRYEAQISLRFMMTCRDTLLLEIERINSKGKSGLRADEGKTLGDCFTSYLSVNFTRVQQATIKDKMFDGTGISFQFLFIQKMYRKPEYMDIFKKEFKASGYLDKNSVSGLGSIEKEVWRDTGFRNMPPESFE